MKSVTKITSQSDRKTNVVLLETIRAAKKLSAWIPVASVLSSPRSQWKQLTLADLSKLDANAKQVVVPGKILSQGLAPKKMKVIAFSFSEQARSKLIEAGCECELIYEEIKKNPDAKGLTILK